MAVHTMFVLLVFGIQDTSQAFPTTRPGKLACRSTKLDSFTSPPILPIRTRARFFSYQLFSVDAKDVSPESSKVLPPEDQFDTLLTLPKLSDAITFLRANPHTNFDKDRFFKVFRAIESRTKAAEENFMNKNELQQQLLVIHDDDDDDDDTNNWPGSSPARLEMTKMYDVLQTLGHLRIYGSVKNYPVGSVTGRTPVITPALLERITELDMKALTPQPSTSNAVTLAGVALAVSEGVVSWQTGINYNVLVFSTVSLGLLDQLLVNGAVFETIQRALMPAYGRKIIQHEAGHFLLAYLLGCPVEGCVLSAWDSLADARFGGPGRTGVSAGTSFYDPVLSQQINSSATPLTRSSIDRYTVIVMAGVAAEAVNCGRADGGASDEQALVRFLTGVQGNWNTVESIKSQARWGAVQAVLLLRHYGASYDALVEALEVGGDLAECVYAIEHAALESGTRILTRPLGMVREETGEWVVMDDEEGKEETIRMEGRQVFNASESNKELGKENTETSEDTEALLKSSREILERKIKSIEKKLSDFE